MNNSANSINAAYRLWVLPPSLMTILQVNKLDGDTRKYWQWYCIPIGIGQPLVG